MYSDLFERYNQGVNQLIGSLMIKELPDEDDMGVALDHLSVSFRIQEPKDHPSEVLQALMTINGALDEMLKRLKDATTGQENELWKAYGLLDSGELIFVLSNPLLERILKVFSWVEAFRDLNAKRLEVISLLSRLDEAIEESWRTERPRFVSEGSIDDPDLQSTEAKAIFRRSLVDRSR